VYFRCQVLQLFCPFPRVRLLSFSSVCTCSTIQYQPVVSFLYILIIWRYADAPFLSQIAQQLNQSTEVLQAPIKMSDLFNSDAPVAKVSRGTQGSEYLFGPSERKEKAAKKKVENLPASMTPATFFVSRKKKNSQGLGRDIHLDNFDISIAGRSLLKNASLKLIHGRRFGLVGRNGMGKSTLLRHISGRELVIPDHLQILHVEQEVRTPSVSYLITSYVNPPFSVPLCGIGHCGNIFAVISHPLRRELNVSEEHSAIASLQLFIKEDMFWAERFLFFHFFPSSIF
jgi:hypothetical protein